VEVVELHAFGDLTTFEEKPGPDRDCGVGQVSREPIES